MAKITNLNLKELLNNPAGKGSGHTAARYAIKENLDRRYNALISKHSKFTYNIYRDGTSYFFHFKIPSETHDDFFYDVVLEFYPENHIDNLRAYLTDYEIRVFSNSPAFTFTYTYVVNDSKRTIKQLMSKYSNDALTNQPVVRNPVENYGFEKSVYYAAMYIQKNRLLLVSKLSSMIKKDKISSMVNKVSNQESKVAKFKQLKKQKTKTKEDPTTKARTKQTKTSVTKANKTKTSKKIKPKKKK